jgi:hypothetical protein
VTAEGVPKLLDFGIAKNHRPGVFPATCSADRNRHARDDAGIC